MVNDEKIDWLAICSQNNIEAINFIDFIKEKIATCPSDNSIKSDNNVIISKDYISLMNRLINNFSLLPFVVEPIPDKKFCCKITYKGKDVEGIGLSKKEAKQKACKQLYEIETGYEEKPDKNLTRSESEESNLSSIRSDSSIKVTTPSDESSKCLIEKTTPIILPTSPSTTTTFDYISNLQIICSKNRQFTNMPDYTFKQIDHIHYCTCYLQTKVINGQSFNGHGESTNKKEAKKQAAQQAYVAYNAYFGR